MLGAIGLGVNLASQFIGGLNQAESARFNAAQQREQARFTEAVGKQKRRAALRAFGEAMASARAASAASGVAPSGDFDVIAQIAETQGRQVAAIETETEFAVGQQKAQAKAYSQQAKAAGFGSLAMLGVAAGGLALALGKGD